MLVEKIKELTADLNTPFNEGEEKYHFNNGGHHWQNLNDSKDDSLEPFEDRNKFILLLWQDRDRKFSDYSVVIGVEWTGEMLLLVRSKFSDPDYNYKYDTHIKNLYEESEAISDYFGFCDGWTVKRWKETEVENAYDNNMDGLRISFTLNYEAE